MRPLTAPSPLVAAATTEGLVRVLDMRTSGSGADLRVSYGAPGFVRSLAVSGSATTSWRWDTAPATSP